MTPLGAGTSSRQQDEDASFARFRSQRDEASFEALVTPHLPRLHRLAVIWSGDLASADAAIAETLERAWRGAADCQPGRPGWFGAWLTTVTRNACRSQRRGQHRRAQYERRAGDPGLLPPDGDPAERLADEERVAAVLDHLVALPAHERQVLEARYLHDRSVAEIAAELDVPEPTVRSRLRRGLAQLRRRLGSAAVLLIAARLELAATVQRSSVASLPARARFRQSRRPAVVALALAGTALLMVLGIVIGLMTRWGDATPGPTVEPSDEPELARATGAPQELGRASDAVGAGAAAGSMQWQLVERRVLRIPEAHVIDPDQPDIGFFEADLAFYAVTIDEVPLGVVMQAYAQACDLPLEFAPGVDRARRVSYAHEHRALLAIASDILGPLGLRLISAQDPSGRVVLHVLPDRRDAPL